MTQNAPKYIKLLKERVERLEAENARCQASLTISHDLLIRCWKAGHRQGWQDGETNAEVFDAVNNFLTDELGPRWGEEFADD